MAGKTLSGIGEDESGKHELALDESGPSWRQEKTPATRSTDRMPLSTIIGGPVPQTPAVDKDVSEDKVAEGLKKLRSLDEPLGSISALPTSGSSMPTLKEGIPAIGAASTPFKLPPATAELIRSRGTAHGHALSAAAGQGNLPISVDDRMKGTLLGHSLHLPDLPETTDENRRAEVLAIARPPASDAIVLESGAGFSHGDAQFFDSDPTINPEYEPENPRGKLMARGAIFLAVVSVFVVAAIAWVRVRKPENPSMEVRATPPSAAGTAPSGLDNPAASAGTAPANAAAAPAEVSQPAAASAAPAPVGTVAPTPPAEAPTPPAEAAPEAAPAPVPPVRAHVRHHEAAAVTAPVTKPTAPPTARPVGPVHENKPVVPGKRGKAVDDPDGTLPLSE
jgi:hypothetical protein